MLKVAVASAVQLSVYDISKRRLQRSAKLQTRVGQTGTHIAASVLASFCVVTVINPMEVRLLRPSLPPRPLHVHSLATSGRYLYARHCTCEDVMD